MTIKINPKIEKLLRLAYHPSTPEAEAEAALRRATLMAQKLGVGLPSTVDIKEYKFPFRSDYERRLCIQITANICGVETDIYREKRNLYIDLTEDQYTRVSVAYSHYRRELKRLFEDVYKAMIHRAQLGIPSTRETLPDDEELAEIKRILNLNIELNELHQQIAAGE